jgi:hypothetical protein
MYDSIFVKPWPFWVAGLAIGLFVPLLAWSTGKSARHLVGLRRDVQRARAGRP